MDIPGLEAIRAAAERIAGQAHRTPVHTSAALDARAGRSLFFKCENLQRVGAFKFRGALNAVLRLDPDRARRGVVTHSSGNHAQAVALAARLRGIPAHIVMPTTSPAVKRAAVAGYGARITPCAPTLEAREAAARQLLDQTGGTLIHPYDHPDVIAGQGTVGLELLEQVPDLDAILVPVGGGGLIAGIAIATRELSPRVEIHGAEPAGADDAYRSKTTGTRVLLHQPRTLADGLLTTLGDRTWPVVRDQVQAIHLVSDAQILDAMRWVWERMKLVIEPSAAVGVAVACSGTLDPSLKRIGVVLTGGNVDLDPLFAAYAPSSGA